MSASTSTVATPNKDKIVSVLETLCEMYKMMPNKKFQLRAVQTAMLNLKKYDGTGGDILSGIDASKKVKGIGKGMIRRIDEILKTGGLNELDGAKGGSEGSEGSEGSAGAGGNPKAAKRAKKGDTSIINVTGIGPVKAKKLSDEGYLDIAALREGVKSGKVKLTHHMKVGVKYYEDFLERIPRPEIVKIEELLRKHLTAIGGSGGIGSGGEYLLEVCGSYRRGREDCGDVDVLMSYKGMKEINGELLTMFVNSLTDCGFIIDHLTTKIKTKYMGVCKMGKKGVARRIDIRCVPYSCFYPALIYFTGSKEFNIDIRRKALDNGYSLSEYGFKNVDDDSLVTFDSEKEIFDFLSMDFIEPTKR